MQRRSSFVLGTFNAFKGANFHGSRPALKGNPTDSNPPNLKEASISRTNGTMASLSQSIQVDQTLKAGKEKTKLIKKVGKGKKAGKDEEKKEKQVLKFKYFRRKISPISVMQIAQPSSSSFLSYSQKFSPFGSSKFQIYHVLDWQMEAIKNLSLAKDSFYAAVVMAQEFFVFPSRLMSEKFVNLYAMAIVSLAAKFEDSTLNYTEVLSGMCRASKQQLIDAQISVSTAIKFAYPVVSVQSQIVEVCVQWHEFITNNRGSLKINPAVVELGSSWKISEWGINSQNKIQDIFYFFDVIMLRCPQLFSIKNKGDVKVAVSFAMFTVMRHLIKQFFPSSPTEKTYLVILFHTFLSSYLAYSSTDNLAWSTKLIAVKNQLKLVENADSYFNSKMNREKAREEEQSQYNTRQSAMIVKKRQQSYFFKQQYHQFFLKWS